MEKEINANTITPPVPKPRNLLKKSQYENISISEQKLEKDFNRNNNIGNNSENDVLKNITSQNTSGISDLGLGISNLPAHDNSFKRDHNDFKEFNKVNNYPKNDNMPIYAVPSSAKKTPIYKTENGEYEFIYKKKEWDEKHLILPKSDNFESLSRNSTPEPFYTNQNQLSTSFNLDIFRGSDRNSTIQRDVLYEFDPLMHQRNSTKNEVSNQLLLLENLLQEDIYKNIFGGSKEKNFLNEDLSDDENISVVNYLPPVPTRVDSLETTANSSLINVEETVSNVSSESQYHIVQDTLEEPKNTLKEKELESLDKKEIQKKKPQTNWYLNCPNEFPPPPYSKYSTSNPNIHLNINGKSEINKMISNFCSKINVLKKKSLIKSVPIIENNDQIEFIPRPKLSESMIRHEGFLIRFPSGTIEDIFKELQNRKAFIRDFKFLAYQESEQKNLKETIHLHEITTIQCISNSKITENSTHYYCFEITTVLSKVHSQQRLLSANTYLNNWIGGSYKAQRLTHLYGISKESERDLWMQKLLQSLTDVFPAHLACQFYRAGWCYLKKSITAEWSGAWILLIKRKRKLFFFNESELSLEKLDLRKARCIVMKEVDNSIDNLFIEKGPILMIDCPPFSLYLIMSSPRETKIWKHIIREVACNNGPGLEEQQLTKTNIPVIIDKCINFIYIHGSMSEGIYRKSGSENSIQKLIYEFRSNAFNVEITKTDFNEHDVANVLKRFMRNLPQRLLGKYTESFISVAKINLLEDKLNAYKELLTRLSSIEFMTIKKLLNHLAFIESQSKYNKMTLENLAVVWGPALLQTKNSDEYNQLENEVINDLIKNFKTFFPLSKDEINKEKSMLQYLKKYYAASESLNDLTTKQSGDLKVWILLKLNSSNIKTEEQNICTILNPSKTTLDVCREIALKINKPEKEMCLFEVIFNDSLERPLDNNEKLFHTVLRWSYWSNEERKNNFLVLKSSKYIEKIYRTLNIMKNFTLKKILHYADSKTKSLKLYEIELKNSDIFINKISKGGVSPSKVLNLKNYSFYLGSERKISFEWAITLVENNQTPSLKNPETSFAGHVIAGNNKDDQLIIYSSFWNKIHCD